MGRPIAKEMAEALNVEFYDRDLIEAAAKKMNMSLSIASDLEDSANPNRFWRMCFPLGHDETRKQDELFQVEKKIILNLADAKSCIIVGRCSDSILKCSKHLLRIFIYAPYKERLKNCVERLKMDERTAKDMMRPRRLPGSLCRLSARRLPPYGPAHQQQLSRRRSDGPVFDRTRTQKIRLPPHCVRLAELPPGTSSSLLTNKKAYCMIVVTIS